MVTASIPADASLPPAKHAVLGPWAFFLRRMKTPAAHALLGDGHLRRPTSAASVLPADPTRLPQLASVGGPRLPPPQPPAASPRPVCPTPKLLARDRPAGRCGPSGWRYASCVECHQMSKLQDQTKQKS